MKTEWKLVPAEPTGEQEEAGCQGYMEADGNWVMHRSSMGHAYKAMLGGEPETAAWLDLEKLKSGGMAYATNMKVNHRQTELIDRAHFAPLLAEIEQNKSDTQARLEWAKEAVAEIDRLQGIEEERDTLKARCEELEAERTKARATRDELFEVSKHWKSKLDTAAALLTDLCDTAYIQSSEGADAHGAARSFLADQSAPAAKDGAQ